MIIILILAITVICTTLTFVLFPKKRNGATFEEEPVKVRRAAPVRPEEPEATGDTVVEPTYEESLLAEMDGDLQDRYYSEDLEEDGKAEIRRTLESQGYRFVTDGHGGPGAQEVRETRDEGLENGIQNRSRNEK